MCVKFSPENLNLGSYPPHPTNIYICEVNITLRVYGGFGKVFLNNLFFFFFFESKTTLYVINNKSL